MKKNTAPKGIKIKMSREEIAYQIFIAVVVGLLVLCCLIPFLYVVGMSFTSEGEMIQRNFFVIIPQKPILAAYEYLLKNKDFFSGMGITIVRTAMGVCTALILTVPVGYILAIGDLPFKNGIMVFFITTMVLVRVHALIKEGNRERVQVFEGTVLKKQGGSNRATFTVRKSSNGVGVEKTWPLHSPHVVKVEVIRRGKVRRAKLNYLRDRVGKAAKVKELVK